MQKSFEHASCNYHGKYACLYPPELRSKHVHCAGAAFGTQCYVGKDEAGSSLMRATDSKTQCTDDASIRLQYEVLLDVIQG